MSETRSKQSQAQRITIIGSVIDGILGVLKIVFGMLAHSSALIADGIHSLSDLVTDFLVVWIIKYSHQEPDEEHPWGHARFETIGTVILGCILIAVAGAMAYESHPRGLWTSPTQHRRNDNRHRQPRPELPRITLLPYPLPLQI